MELMEWKKQRLKARNCQEKKVQERVGGPELRHFMGPKVLKILVVVIPKEGLGIELFPGLFPDYKSV